MSYLFDVVTPEYLLTALAVVLAPGIGAIYALSHGLFRGPRASVVAAFGCTLGILPHMAAGILGLAALLHASAVAFEVVRMAGVAYLLYLAWGMWRGSAAIVAEAPSGPARAGAIVRRGFLINILNPKLSAFFLAFLPQFVPQTATDGWQRMGLLSLTFMLLTFIVFSGYGLGASALKARILSSARLTRRLQRGFAAVFAGFACKLALTDR